MLIVPWFEGEILWEVRPILNDPARREHTVLVMAPEFHSEKVRIRITEKLGRWKWPEYEAPGMVFRINASLGFASRLPFPHRDFPSESGISANAVRKFLGLPGSNSYRDKWR